MSAANPPIGSEWIERRGRCAVVVGADERYVYLLTEGSHRRHTRVLRHTFRNAYRRAEIAANG